MPPPPPPPPPGPIIMDGGVVHLSPPPPPPPPPPISVHMSMLPGGEGFSEFGGPSMVEGPPPPLPPPPPPLPPLSPETSEDEASDDDDEEDEGGATCPLMSRHLGGRGWRRCRRCRTLVMLATQVARGQDSEDENESGSEMSGSEMREGGDYDESVMSEA